MVQGMIQKPALDIDRIRAEFPILSRTANGKPLVYLDNAATSQKPQAVIDAIAHYYSHYNSNVHRGVHSLSQEATEAYEGAREKIRAHINAEDTRQIIFTGGTTDGNNLITQTYGRSQLKKGDEVLITHMEHHSNIVPWQMVCEQTGATLKVVPINDAGELELEAFENLLNERTKIVALNHISNALGTINPIAWIAKKAHGVGAVVCIDGAQAMPHLKVDVQALDVDFYSFSSHKMFGPTGVGVLYGKAHLLEAMPPYRGGGDMIKKVSFEKTVYNDLPYRFEAGTPNIAGVIGLGAAVDYLNGIGMDAIAAYENQLIAYGQDRLSQIKGLRFIGTAKEKAGVFGFVLDGAHPQDVGTILDHEGIAVRTGHHCAQPIMDRFGITATVRASLAFYNNTQDLDALYLGLKKVQDLFG